MNREPRLIYISGRGGDARKGLGGYLKQLDPNRIGLSVNESFLQRDFHEQVSVVRQLLDEFDGENTKVIANSYGAYLLLHALIDAPRYLLKGLLLSPAIGGVLNSNSLAYARQPSTNRFDEALIDRAFTKPRYLALHIGDLDVGYDSQRFEELDESLELDLLDIIPGQGHMLDRDIVKIILKHFFRFDRSGTQNK